MTNRMTVNMCVNAQHGDLHFREHGSLPDVENHLRSKYPSYELIYASECTNLHHTVIHAPVIGNGFFSEV